MWQPGQSVRACPMWVSLINRVYRVLFLALYYHPPAVPCPVVFLRLLCLHLLPPALPQDPVDAPGGCGKRKLRATRPSSSFPPLLFARPPLRTAVRIYICAPSCIYSRCICSILLGNAPRAPSLVFPRSRLHANKSFVVRRTIWRRDMRIISRYSSMYTVSRSFFYRKGETGVRNAIDNETRDTRKSEVRTC